MMKHQGGKSETPVLQNFFEVRGSTGEYDGVRKSRFLPLVKYAFEKRISYYLLIDFSF
jgi:hypothetical protein